MKPTKEPERLRLPRGRRSGVCRIRQALLSLLAVLSVLQIANTQSVLFSDDFESYAVGTFPGNGWILVYNGAGTELQVVRDDLAVSGTKALRLVGQPGWAADATIPMLLPSRFAIDAHIYVEGNGSGTVSAVNHGLGSWGTYYGTVWFVNGQIRAQLQTYNSAGQVDLVTTNLMSYAPNRWYQVRSELDLEARSFDVYVDGQVVAMGLPILDPGFPAGIEFNNGSGGSRFDDLTVTSLALTSEPPTIRSQPASQTVFVGDTLQLSVAAKGTWPFTYQWRKDGVDIVGATNNTLVLSTVTAASAGDYTVLVSNEFGAVTSEVARVTMVVVGPDDLARGLIAWWPGEGNALDLVGANDGVLMNGVAFAPGWIGESFRFDGVDDMVVNPAPSLTTVRDSFTIAFWTFPEGSRASTPETSGGIYGFNTQRYAVPPEQGIDAGVEPNAAGAGVSVGVDGISVFEHSENYLPSLLVYDAAISGWTHLAVVYEQKQPRLYVNGALVRSGLTSSRTFVFPSKVLGGNQHLGGFYRGLLDEVCIYDRALSAAEVSALCHFSGEADQPPTIRIQPIGQTNFVGETFRLSVVPTGTWPFRYQWRKDGSNILGATNSTLVLSNVTAAAAGDYTVVVSNEFGSATSEVARVVVTTRTSLYIADFEGTVGPEWSHRQIDVTPIGNRRFLGQFGNDTVSLTLNGLPAHQNVTVSFDLFVIASWDGNFDTYSTDGPDLWEFSVVGGPTLLHTTFLLYPYGAPVTQAFPDNYQGGSYPARTGAAENNTLGYAYWGTPMDPMDCVYHLVFSIPHTTDTISVKFSGQNLQEVSDESWGLDNVLVELTPAGSDPYVLTSLVSAGTWVPTNALPVTGITVSGNRALACLNDAQFLLLDTTSPAAPIALGSWIPFVPPADAVLVGNRAYLACWELDFLSTIEIVDFTDPANPVLLGYFDTPGYAQDIEVVGNTAYVADSEAGLLILDVSDPAAPRQVGSYDTLGSIEMVHVAGRYAFLATGDWLFVVDIANPFLPVRVGLYDAGSAIRSLAALGMRVYLTTSTGELQVLDAADPGGLELLGTCRVWGNVQGMVASGRHVYVAKGSSGLQVLDVGDPAKPTTLVSDYSIPAVDLALTGKYTLVAAGGKGLLVYELHQELYPSLKPPVLGDGTVTLTWGTTNDIRLQMATNLVNPVWVDIPESENTNTLTLPITEAKSFFRLVKGPMLPATNGMVWIPPGSFLMGSPADEVDRDD